MSVEALLLVISLLFFLSILACKAGYRFGTPVLLLFLGVGMLCGSDGLGIQFTSMPMAEAIGTVAMCVILFSGGLDTKIDDIKPVLGPGIVLATAGVVLTAAFSGLLIWLIFDLTAPTAAHISLIAALLLASMMSSTDSASVFSILRAKGLLLKNNLRPLLELESGSNDPMAYMLTITFISLALQGGQPDYLMAVLELLKQFVVGALIGGIFGFLFVELINRLKIDNQSLYPIAVLTACIFAFSSSYFLGGNSYLAVYIGGVVMGNSRFVHKRSAVNFFDGLAWLSQLMMFLTLGLIVNPHELIPMLIPGLIISAVMILVTRPASVFLSLAPFRSISTNAKLFVSWVGLRGAVPIIFAILALSANVPHARTLFDIVFVCTLVSLIVQGTTLGAMAAKLHLLDTPQQLGRVKDFDMEFSDEIKSVMAELTVSEQILTFGSTLLDLPLPEQCLAVLVKRGEAFFVPSGKTALVLGDKVLLISDDHKLLMSALSQMGVRPEEEPQNPGFSLDTFYMGKKRGPRDFFRDVRSFGENVLRFPGRFIDETIKHHAKNNPSNDDADANH